MKDVYKSKIGPPIIFPLCTVGGMFIAMIITRAWPAVLIMGVLILVLIHTYFNTYYTIAGNELKVRYGFIINKTIDIGSIKKVVSTRDMRSAPALSTDRVEIFYNQNDSVLISPEDQAEFIERLKAINGEIVV
jgi:hypothetical protein